MSNDKWSGEVKTRWHPPEGFFDRSAQDIASGLKEASDSHEQAMDRLNFYINRAGSNLTGERRAVLENAKQLLEKMYGDCSTC